MALDFPSSPSNGQKYPASPVAGQPTYTWDGEKWTTSTGAVASLYVTKSGDTMTGHLSLPTSPAADQAVRKDYVDAADSAISGKVAKTGDTMTAPLYIAPPTDAALYLMKGGATSGSGKIASVSGFSSVSGVPKGRWGLVLGDALAESGSNNGSDFTIQRYNDAGGYIDSPMVIRRVNGDTTFYSSVATQGNLYCQNGTLFCQANMTVGGASVSTGLYGDGGSVALRTYGNGNIYLQNGGGTSNYLTAGPGSAVFVGGLSATQYNLSNGNSWLFSDSGGQSTWYLNGSACYLNYTKPNGFLYFAVNGAELCRWQYSGGDIVVGQGWKPGGGVWADNSDARIKNVKGEYKLGLEDLSKLRPVTYTFIGNDTREEPDYVRTDEEKRIAKESKVVEEPVTVPYPNSAHRRQAESQQEFVGLLAQEVETIFPSMVKKSDGYINGEPVTDMRSLDTTELIFTLINAVKELKARVEVLEAA